MRREEIERIWGNQLRRAGGENAYRHDPTFALLVKQGLEVLAAADEVLSRLDLPVEDWQRRWFAEQLAEKLMPPVNEAEQRLLEYAELLDKERSRPPVAFVRYDQQTHDARRALRAQGLPLPGETVRCGPDGPVGPLLPGVTYVSDRTDFKRWHDDDEERG